MLGHDGPSEVIDRLPQLLWRRNTATPGSNIEKEAMPGLAILNQR